MSATSAARRTLADCVDFSPLLLSGTRVAFVGCDRDGNYKVADATGERYIGEYCAKDDGSVVGTDYAGRLFNAANESIAICIMVAQFSAY